MRCAGAVHLAVLREPHLSRMLRGVKTVEGRFCRVRRPPMGEVEAGDVVLLKRAGGPVVGWCVVGAVRWFDLREHPLNRVRAAFDRAMGEPGAPFWRAVGGEADGRAARYVTLVEVCCVRSLNTPLPCAKTDRRGWVVLRRRGARRALPGVGAPYA